MAGQVWGGGRGHVGANLRRPAALRETFRLGDDLQDCSGARQMRPSWAKHSSVGRHWGLITLGLRGGRHTARIIHSLPSDTLSTV